MQCAAAIISTSGPVSGSEVSTCQCREGLSGDSPNPLTRLVPRCVEDDSSREEGNDDEEEESDDDRFEEYGEYEYEEGQQEVFGGIVVNADGEEGDGGGLEFEVTKEELLALISRELTPKKLALALVEPSFTISSPLQCFPRDPLMLKPLPPPWALTPRH